LPIDFNQAITTASHRGLGLSQLPLQLGGIARNHGCAKSAEVIRWLESPAKGTDHYHRHFCSPKIRRIYASKRPWSQSAGYGKRITITATNIEWAVNTT